MMRIAWASIIICCSSFIIAVIYIQPSQSYVTLYERSTSLSSSSSCSLSPPSSSLALALAFSSSSSIAKRIVPASKTKGSYNSRTICRFTTTGEGLITTSSSSFSSYSYTNRKHHRHSRMVIQNNNLRLRSTTANNNGGSGGNRGNSVPVILPSMLSNEDDSSSSSFDVNSNTNDNGKNFTLDDKNGNNNIDEQNLRGRRNTDVKNKSEYFTSGNYIAVDKSNNNNNNDSSLTSLSSSTSFSSQSTASTAALSTTTTTSAKASPMVSTNSSFSTSSSSSSMKKRKKKNTIVKNEFQQIWDAFFFDEKNSSATGAGGTNVAPISSVVLLNLVAIIWGSQHAVIKMVVQDSENAAGFTLLRFGLAALLATPYLPKLSSIWETTKTTTETTTSTAKNNTTQLRMSTAVVDDNDHQLEQQRRRKEEALDAWRWGAEMGTWMFLGFSFQAIGLLSTTAQRSGFLLYLNVKFVPFFARVLLGRPISIPTWVSAFAAFAGTSLLALDDGGGSTTMTTATTATATSISLNEGDLWSIAAAAASAMFILRLEEASTRVKDSAQLNATCLWVVCILSLLWTLFTSSGVIGGSAVGTNGPADLDWSVMISDLYTIASTHPWEVIYLGGVTTALANYIQTKAQKDISAERASVIYSLDPVYGAVFSYVILSETLGGIQAYIGATLITIAAATNAFLDFTPKTSSYKKEEDPTELTQMKQSNYKNVPKNNDGTFDV